MREKFNGKSIEVGIKDVAPQMRKVVLSMQQATNNRLIKKLTVRAWPHAPTYRFQPNAAEPGSRKVHPIAAPPALVYH